MYRLNLSSLREAWFRWLVRAVGVCLLLGGLGTAARAGELVVTPDFFDLSLTPGQPLILKGAITNTTGFDLRSHEVFFSISAYPEDLLTIDILLGLTDIALLDRTRVCDLDLFALTLVDTGAPLESFSFDVSAFDVNGNFAQTFTLNVQVAQGVPEPATWALLLLAGLLLRTQHSRSRLI